MNLQLEGKTALITGSTSGIGKASARALLEEGVTVLVNGRSRESVEAAVEELAEHGDARLQRVGAQGLTTKSPMTAT